jgi:hypothetical protein
MAIGIYIRPRAMTTEQYDETVRRLEEAGAGRPEGRLFHSCFGSESIAIYDVWESREAFDAFGETLMPILGELGVDLGQPDVVPIHNLIQ